MKLYPLVFLTSILGSLHCLGMCSPLMMTLRNSPLNFFTYQTARLISYIALGLIAFFLGRSLDLSLYFLPIQRISFFIGVFFLVVFGLAQIFSKNLHQFIPSFFSKYFYGLLKNKKPGSFIYALTLGLVTGLLPCGWLFGFIASSMLVDNYLDNIGYIMSFWAGALPIFSLVFFVGNRVFQKFKIPSKVFGTVMIIMSLTFIVKRYYFGPGNPLINSTSCHEHSGH